MGRILARRFLGESNSLDDYIICALIGCRHHLLFVDQVKMKKYLITSAGITAILLILDSLDSMLPWQFHEYFAWLVGFFFLQSLGVSWMLSTAEKDVQKLPILAIGAMVLRFVSALLFLLIFFIIGLENPNALVIQFLLVYLLHMLFELMLVLANLRRN